MTDGVIGRLPQNATRRRFWVPATTATGIRCRTGDERRLGLCRVRCHGRRRSARRSSRTPRNCCTRPHHPRAAAAPAVLWRRDGPGSDQRAQRPGNQLSPWSRRAGRHAAARSLGVSAGMELVSGARRAGLPDPAWVFASLDHARRGRWTACRRWPTPTCPRAGGRRCRQRLPQPRQLRLPRRPTRAPALATASPSTCGRATNRARPT